MDRMDKKDLERFRMAEYRILAKNTKGKTVADSVADKTFKDSPLEFEQVNETLTSMRAKKDETVNRAVLQMREKNKKKWITIADRVFPVILLMAGDVLGIKWSLKIISGKGVVAVID